MSSAFDKYCPKGITAKSSFGKVNASAELSKSGDFIVNAGTKGNCGEIGYNVDVNCLNLSKIDVSSRFTHSYKLQLENVKAKLNTKVGIDYDDIQDIDLKKPFPTGLFISETINTDISSTSLTYKPGKKQKLEMSNSMGYSFGMFDLKLKFPDIDLLNVKNVKDLAQDAEISISRNSKELKAGIKATKLGNNIQLFLEDNFGFFRGKTTLKTDLQEKTIKSAFERELVLSKNVALATRFSFENIENVNREYGIVLESNKKDLKFRGMMDRKGIKKVSVDHKVSDNVKFHMVGTSSPSEGRKAEDGAGRTFWVGITFGM